MKKILVTGATGYIGSHTVVALAEAGYLPILLDDFSNSSAEVLPRLAKIIGYPPPFYQLNLCDKVALNEVFAQEQTICAVMHFAASKAVGESVANPLKYYHNNLLSLLHLLESMPAHEVHTFIFSSSCTVYGQPTTLPVTEESPVLPAESPYGNTKQIGEEILRDASRADTALRVVSLRYFNPVGAHPSGLIGELPNGTPSNLMPFITQTAAGLREKIAVFGNDYPTPDGSCVRDYIHVVDLAEAHVVALTRALHNNMDAPFEVFNLGTGKGHSVLEVIRTFERVNQVSLPYEIAPRRPGDVEQVWADTTRANTVLKWKAERTLEEMVRSAWLWEQQRTQPLT